MSLLIFFLFVEVRETPPPAIFEKKGTQNRKKSNKIITKGIKD